MDAHTMQILEAALGLPDEEREEVALQLIDSLKPVVDDGYAAAWEAELQRRITELEQGNVPGIPWEEVRKKLRAKL